MQQTFEIINSCAAEHLTDLLETYVPPRFLGFATGCLLVVPKSFTSTYGDRDFSFTAPKLWNKLPANMRTTSALDFFKKDTSLSRRIPIAFPFSKMSVREEDIGTENGYRTAYLMSLSGLGKLLNSVVM